MPSSAAGGSTRAGSSSSERRSWQGGQSEYSAIESEAGSTSAWDPESDALDRLWWLKNPKRLSQAEVDWDGGTSEEEEISGKVGGKRKRNITTKDIGTSHGSRKKNVPNEKRRKKKLERAILFQKQYDFTSKTAAMQRANNERPYQTLTHEAIEGHNQMAENQQECVRGRVMGQVPQYKQSRRFDGIRDIPREDRRPYRLVAPTRIPNLARASLANSGNIECIVATRCPISNAMSR